jgi:hypothetical protein
VRARFRQRHSASTASSIIACQTLPVTVQDGFSFVELNGKLVYYVPIAIAGASKAGRAEEVAIALPEFDHRGRTEPRRNRPMMSYLGTSPELADERADPGGDILLAVPKPASEVVCGDRRGCER